MLADKQDLKQLTEATKDMREFVMFIDRGLAPLVNTGVVMTVTVGKDKFAHYIVTCVRHMRDFLSTDELLVIKRALETNDLSEIKERGLDKIIRCVKCPTYTPMWQLTQNDSAGVLIGSIIHSTYTEIKNSTFGLIGEPSYSYPFRNCSYSCFAAKCRVLFTNAPAGMRTVSSIEVVKASNYNIEPAPVDNKMVLVGLAENNKFIIANTNNLEDQHVVKADDYIILDNRITVATKQVVYTVELLKTIEKLNAAYDQLAKDRDEISAKFAAATMVESEYKRREEEFIQQLDAKDEIIKKLEAKISRLVSKRVTVIKKKKSK